MPPMYILILYMWSAAALCRAQLCRAYIQQSRSESNPVERLNTLVMVEIRNGYRIVLRKQYTMQFSPKIKHLPIQDPEHGPVLVAMSPSKVFTSSCVYFPDSAPSPGTIQVDCDSGRIVSVTRDKAQPGDNRFSEDAEWIDFGDYAIIPGLVDAHVHLNEPGRTDWEGFRTGTQAAASGGCTTVVDMPLNSLPPTTTTENLRIKREAAKNQCWTDVGFWGGVIPGNASDLRPLVVDGVKGFKCFLIESGVEEFPCVNEHDLNLAMERLEGEPTVLLFHAELDRSVKGSGDNDPNDYDTFLRSRPELFETDAIKLIVKLLRKYSQLKCHIVHLSAHSAIPIIRKARQDNLPLTVETCFHYLTLVSDDIPRGKPEFKCCPPIRDTRNQDKLWEALLDGTIDMVVSDHSPCVAELKEGNFMDAWGGISTLGLGLSLLSTAAKKRGIPFERILTWCSTNTARHAGLADRKGGLAVGKDADFAVWDPTAEFKVTKESLNFKNKLSAYVGQSLNGQVLQTYVRGVQVFDRETGFNTHGLGTFV